MTEEEAELRAIEHELEKAKNGILFCPITTFKVEDGWICEAYYDGGNHYISVFSNEQHEAVKYAKQWVEEIFSGYDTIYKSFEYDEEIAELGDRPLCKNSNGANVKIIFRRDDE